MKSKKNIFLNNMNEQSNIYGLARIFTAILILSLTTYLISANQRIYLKLLLAFINGFIISGLFSNLHFCAHGTLFNKKWLNNFFGRASACFLLLNYSSYKYFHMQHHRHTAEPGDSEPAGEIRNVIWYFFYSLNWDYIFAFARISLASLFDFFPFFARSLKARKEIRRDSLFFIFTLSLALMLFYQYNVRFFWSYLVPLQIAYTINFFLVIGEHLPHVSENSMFGCSRTFSRQNLLFSFFHYNSNYHAAHHFLAYIPPSKLPRLQTILEEKQNVPPVGYIEFNKELIKSLWNNPKQKAAKAPEGREANFLYKLRRSNV